MFNNYVVFNWNAVLNHLWGLGWNLILVKLMEGLYDLDYESKVCYIKLTWFTGYNFYMLIFTKIIARLVFLIQTIYMYTYM